MFSHCIPTINNSPRDIWLERCLNTLPLVNYIICSCTYNRKTYSHDQR